MLCYLICVIIILSLSCYFSIWIGMSCHISILILPCHICIWIAKLFHFYVTFQFQFSNVMFHTNCMLCHFPCHIVIPVLSCYVFIWILMSCHFLCHVATPSLASYDALEVSWYIIFYVRFCHVILHSNCMSCYFSCPILFLILPCHIAHDITLMGKNIRNTCHSDNDDLCLYFM